MTVPSGISSDKRRPRLLFVTPWVPKPTSSGGQIVSYGLLQMYARDFDVDIVCGVSEADSAPFVPPQGAAVIAAVPIRLQFGANRLFSVVTALFAWARCRSMREAKMATSSMAAAVRRAMELVPYDIVHVDLTLLTRAVPGSANLVVSAQNIEVEVMERLAHSSPNIIRRVGASIEAWATKRAERDALTRAGSVITMNHRDAVLLSERYDVEKGKLFPVYPFVPAAPDASLGGRSQSILLLGSLAAPQRAEGTRWFLDRVWPLVKTDCPGATVEVVGAHPPADVLRRAGGGVNVHGFLADTASVVARARVVAVPLFAGGGVRVKAIEALAWGVPCVSTTVGATGLRDETAPFVRVCDDAEGMAREIIQMLKDDAAWARSSRAGQEHARQFYTSGRARDALAAAVDSALKRGRTDD